MRSVIEASVYLVIMTLMCYIFVDYIRFNMNITDESQQIRYVQDYIEIYGEVDDYGTVCSLTDKFTDELKRVCADKELSVSLEYLEKSQSYYYFTMKVNKMYAFHIFSAVILNETDCIVRVPIV